MSKQLTVKLHSIIFLVGPTNSGKSYFVKNILIPQLKSSSYIPLNIHHLSSDEIRRDLLGKDLDKYDREMIYASKYTFALLEEKLRILTRWPINTDVVIVDTMGMNQYLRNAVINIAHQNHYNLYALILDFKDRDDYFANIKTEQNSFVKTLISKQIVKLRSEIVPNITKKDFTDIFRIKAKDFKINFSIDKTDIISKDRTQLHNNVTYSIIGDIHCCYTELKELIIKLGFEIDTQDKIISKINHQIILIGDILDKGTQLKQTIDFVYHNLSILKIVRGNHENFVYKYFQNPQDNSLSRAEIQKNFNSIITLEKDNDLLQKFFEIYEKTQPFFTHKDFIASHAPSQEKYLGKFDEESQKNQRNIRFPRQSNFETFEQFQNSLETTFDFLKKEAEFSHPFCIFGHVMVKDVLKIDNKIGIDTGCVAGNRLSAVTIQNGKATYTSVPSIQPKGEKLPLLFKQVPIKSTPNPSVFEREIVYQLVQNKIQFLSPTITPAPAYENDLESLQAGLEVFKKLDIVELTLQPKYMGSRVQVYLFADLEKSYLITKSGRKVNFENQLTSISKKDLLGALHQNLLKYFKQNAELIIIDAELMPWMALGKDLVEEQFGVIAHAKSEELEILKEDNLEEMLQNLYHEYKDSEFAKKASGLKKQKVAELFGVRAYRNFRHAGFIMNNHIPVQDQKKLFNEYLRQLEIFTQNQAIHLKAFDILKIIYPDGKEDILQESLNTEIFKSINSDETINININDSDALQKAQEFFDKLTVEQKMEGLVIKPNQKNLQYKLSAVKVRNKEYLTLIYGYDYLHPKRYAELIERKNIKLKMSESIRLFRIAKDLLQIPYNEISLENEKYVKLLMQFITKDRSVKQEIDPRL